MDYRELFEIQNIKYKEENNIFEFLTTRDFVKASQVLFDLKVSHRIIKGSKKIEVIV